MINIMNIKILIIITVILLAFGGYFLFKNSILKTPKIIPGPSSIPTQTITPASESFQPPPIATATAKPAQPIKGELKKSGQGFGTPPPFED